ncbi:MAG: carbohydrate binding domain-containing protein [Spirochaetes bacterium]|nr:carbohydrate binding domain-containing protein [Spirochaetota bacterium]
MKKLCTSLIAACFMSAVLVTAQEAVSNGGFENGLDGWNKAISRDARASWEISDVAYQSQKSLLIKNATAKQANVYGTLWQKITVQPKKTYVITAWVKGVNVSGAVFTIDKKWMIRKSCPNGSYDWYKISFTYTVPEHETSAELRLITENITELLYVDGISVTEEKMPFNKIDRRIDSLGASLFVPLLYANTVIIDGNTDDWKGFSGIALPTLPVQTVMKDWNGENDLSAKIRFAYDEKNLYLCIKVTDNIQAALPGESMWKGDSVQIGFGTGDSYGPEYGFASVKDRPDVWSWVKGSALSGKEAVKLAVTTKENVITYEIAMPWESVSSSKSVPDRLQFNMLINDDDGNGRKGYIEWTPGIGVSKLPLNFPILAPIEKGKTFSAFTHYYGKEIFKGGTAELGAWMGNISDAAETIRFSTPSGDGELTIPARTVTGITYSMKFADAGNITVPFEVKQNSSGEIVKRIASVNVLDYNAENLIAGLDALAAKLTKLEELFSACKTRKISTDYETVNYTVIKRFIGYGKDDIKNSRLPRAAYVIRELERLYDETTDTLTAYLAKQKSPVPVYRYRTGTMEVKNRSMIADVLEPSGLVKRRPVILTGYGHFGQVRRDVPVFQDFGNNIIQIEVGPSGVVMPPKTTGELCSIDLKKLDQDIIPVLTNAEANNIAVNILLSPHYFPKWALEKWPHLTNYRGGFLKQTIDAPEARAIEEAFLRAVIPVLKKYRSLHSFCLSNEPVYIDSRGDAFTKALWAAYLKRIHGTVENLSKAHGSSYASFDDVQVPNGTKPEATPLFYDWTVFNMERFAGWHRWMAEIVRTTAPEIPLHAKIMPQIFECGGCIGNGIDPERMCDWSDINGCDAWAWVKGEKPHVNKFMFYDLMSSMKAAPIFNSEDHYILDRDSFYGPEQATHVNTDIFMGAFHGRSATTGWLWERTYDEKSDAEGSILHRPDVVAAVGKTGLDLNRLAPEVTAFQDAAANVAILYSVTSLVYSPFYASGVKAAYESILFNGQKAAFVSEKQIVEGKLPSFKLLVVPAAKNVPAAVLAGIKRYASAGGKVLLIGESSLSRDEYDRTAGSDYNTVTASAIMLKNTPPVDELHTYLGKLLNTMGLFPYKLIDTTTKQPVTGVEYRFVKHDNRTLMLAANYTKQKKNITLELGGSRIQRFHDLIAEKPVTAAELTLDPFVPVLLEIK